MQFTNQDFYSNFTASLKSGDLNLTSDILANEISDVIVFDTPKIIDALNKADINITDKVSDEEIVDSVIKGLTDNPKLKKTLAFIIADGNNLINTTKGTDKAKQLQIVTDISNGLSKVNSAIIADTKGFKDETMNQLVSKAESTKAYKRIIWKKDRKNGKAGLYWLIAGVSLIGIVAIIYYRQKKAVQSSLPNMIMGNGEVADFSQPNFHSQMAAPTVEMAKQQVPAILPEIPAAPLAAAPVAVVNTNVAPLHI